MAPKTLKWRIGIPFIVHSEILDVSTNVISKVLDISVVHTDLVGTIGVPSELSLADLIKEYSKLGGDAAETVETVNKALKAFKQAESLFY